MQCTNDAISELGGNLTLMGFFAFYCSYPQRNSLQGDKTIHFNDMANLPNVVTYI